MTDERKEKPAENGQPTEPDHVDVRSPDSGVDWQRPETWPKEVGGKRGPEPTRYGDWESNGRCTDF